MFEFMNLDNASKAEKEIVHSILFRDGESEIRRNTFFKDLSPPYKAILNSSQEVKSEVVEVQNENNEQCSYNYKVERDHHSSCQNDFLDSDVSPNVNGQGNQTHVSNYYPMPPTNAHAGGPPHQISHHGQIFSLGSHLVQGPAGQYLQQFPYQMQYPHAPPQHGIALPPHVQQQYMNPPDASEVAMHQKLHNDIHYSAPDGQTGLSYRNNNNKNARPRRNEVSAYAAPPAAYYPNVNYPPIYFTTQSVTGSPIIMQGSATAGAMYQHAHYTQMYPPNIGNEHDHQGQHPGTMPHASTTPTTIHVSSMAVIPTGPLISNSTAIASYSSPSMGVNSAAPGVMASSVSSDSTCVVSSKAPLSPTQRTSSSNSSSDLTGPKTNNHEDLADLTETKPEKQVKQVSSTENSVKQEVSATPIAKVEPITPVVPNEPVISASSPPVISNVLPSSDSVTPVPTAKNKTPDSVVPVTTASKMIKSSNKSITMSSGLATAFPTPTSEKAYKDSSEFPQLGIVPASVETLPVGNSVQPVRPKSQSWACVASRKTISPTNGISASTAPSNDQSTNLKTTEDITRESMPSNRSTTTPVSGSRDTTSAPDHWSKEFPVEDDPVALRLGEYLSNYVLDHHTFSLTPRGLSNQSNFCYINATLQALVACPPFVNLFRSLYDIIGKKPCKSTPIIQSVFDFIMEFEPITRISQAKNRKPFDSSFYVGANFEASGIRKVLGLLDGATFKVEGRQEDAEEFLSHLLNGLHDEMIKVISGSRSYQEKLTNKSHQTSNQTTVSPPEEDDENDQWQVMGPKNKGCMTRKTSLSKTPISEMFVGQMCSALNKANSLKSTTLQPFFTLQLDIQPENVHTIREALEGLSLKEEVTGCISSNGIETEAWKQLSLEVLPAILILHMKRFVFDTSMNTIKKLDKRVDFSIDLEIAKDLLSLNSKGKYTPKQRQYKLFAVVYHDGEEAIKGHYIADTFHPSGGSLWGQFGWIRYDDTTVKGVVENHILNPQPPRVPYLLYYRRADTLSQSKKDRS